MESASTGQIASTIATSFFQYSPTTSQLQETTMDVSTTSSTKLIVTSLATKLAPSTPISSTCTISTTICSTILSAPISSSILSTSKLSISTSTSAISSSIYTSMGTLPSIAPFFSSIPIFYSISTSIGIQSLSSIPIFTASPSIFTILSIPKVKLVIIEVEQRQPLKLQINGK